MRWLQRKKPNCNHIIIMCYNNIMVNIDRCTCNCIDWECCMVCDIHVIKAGSLKTCLSHLPCNFHM